MLAPWSAITIASSRPLAQDDLNNKELLAYDMLAIILILGFSFAIMACYQDFLRPIFFPQPVFCCFCRLCHINLWNADRTVHCKLDIDKVIARLVPVFFFHLHAVERVLSAYGSVLRSGYLSLWKWFLLAIARCLFVCIITWETCIVSNSRYFSVNLLVFLTNLSLNLLKFPSLKIFIPPPLHYIYHSCLQLL